jgi:hypothetical protein
MNALMMRFNNMFANGKAQSRSPNFPASGSVYAIKPFEDPV